MKKLVKYFLKALYHFRFSRIASNSSREIVVIDIDNTIANTWPSMNMKWKDTYERHESLKPFNNVINFINSNYPHTEFQWIFLTSRKYPLLNTTRNWLIKSNMIVNGNLIIVQSPAEKIQLFKKYLTKSFVYFDDLSYNHENGAIKFYEDEINYVKSREDIVYYGYPELIKLQRENE